MLAGLVWAAVACWRLLWSTSHLIGAWPFAVPQALVLLGFWLSRSTDTIWLIVVSGAVAGLSAYSLHVLRRLALRTGIETSRPAVAVVVAASVLMQLGALLLVRLVAVPDPADPFAAGLARQSWQDVWGTLLVPLLVVAALLVLTRIVLAGRLRWVGRFLSRVTATNQGFHSSGDHQQVGPVTGFSRLTVTGLIVGGMGASLVLFLLPLLDTSDEGAELTFAGIATPEYGKIVFLLALAMLVARHSHRFDAGRGTRLRADLSRVLRRRFSFGELRGLWLRYRYVGYPIGLFTLVAATSAIRRDFGTIVPALAATVGVTWAASWHAARGAGHASGVSAQRVGWRLRRTVRAYRVFIIVGVAIFVVAGTVAVAFTDYLQERGRVWVDPWGFRWEGGCLDPETYPEGVASLPGRPVLCREALVANVESARSQVAQALAAVADGGLWGRGLHDTASGRVPAGTTDFIIAVVWDKLGGLTVLAGALLIVLLAAALRQLTAPAQGPGAVLPSPVALFAGGLAAMVVGQFLFVFTATLGVIPHSGIPVPFLSRGGHATLALLLGICAVVILASQHSPADGTQPVRAGRRVADHDPVPDGPGPVPGGPRLVRVGVLLPFALCLALAVSITVAPYQKPGLLGPTVYDSARPPCQSRAASGEITEQSLLSAPPDAVRCSTDVLAFNRTQVEVRLAGGVTLRQQRPGLTWELVGAERSHGLVLEDLTGLVKVGGSGSGVLDQSFPDIVTGTAGTTLARRLSLNTAGFGPADHAADGVLELTIDPRLQHIAAVALRSDGPTGAGPLAGGIVAIDATTGEVLVSASAPSHLPPAMPGPRSEPTNEVQRFLDTHDSYVERIDGELDRPVPGQVCSRDALNAGDGRSRHCWKWSTRDVPPDTSQASETDLRRYVDKNPDVNLPEPEVNRALGRQYGLGSTFKVVIAAAYLGAGGHDGDPIDAPEVVSLAPDVVVRNAGGGSCAGTDNNGQISLRQALSVSCNTAFVRLAQDIGWPAIAAQAQRFGLATTCPSGTEPESGAMPPAWLAPPMTGAAGSCVPATVPSFAIGSNALGGQDVRGTPLAMATVMAAVANQGQAVQPTLVRSLTDPASGRTSPVVPDRVTALSSTAADELIRALADTAVTGTAAGLQNSVGSPLWGKTGTHEMEGIPLTPGEFARVNSWMVGFVKTPQGRPVSFAVVVEAGDDKTGSQRVRQLVQQLCTAIGKEA